MQSYEQNKKFIREGAIYKADGLNSLWPVSFFIITCVDVSSSVIYIKILYGTGKSIHSQVVGMHDFIAHWLPILKIVSGEKEITMAHLKGLCL